MSFKKLATLALLALGAVAQDTQEPLMQSPDELPEGSDLKSPPAPGLNTVKVAASVVFPDSEVFGIKLVNNHATTASFNIQNADEAPVTVRMLGGSLWPLEITDFTKSHAVRNLSTMAVGIDVPPQANVTIDYKFSTELHPQDLRLLLAAVVADKNGATYQVDGFNGTVSIVEAPLSIFDPQMLFLYLFLAGFFSLTVYFIYNTWIKTFFPQQPKRRPGPVARASSGVLPAQSQGTATGASTYDERWIDPRHLQRPEVRRGRSGTPKTRAK